MTDPAPHDLASLEPLEPLDAGAMAGGPAGGGDDPMLQLMRSGMPAPAFNPYCRDKTFYRFLFAGVREHLLGWPRGLAPDGRRAALAPAAANA